MSAPHHVSTPTWEVDTESEPGLLKVVLRGRPSTENMVAFVAAHHAAVDALEGKDYKVFCDIRELQPLSPQCANLFADAKSYSDSKPNFRGSAVWATSAIVSMQHVRTSRQSGVRSTELLSTDEAALRAHLARVWRG